VVCLDKAYFKDHLFRRTSQLQSVEHVVLVLGAAIVLGLFLTWLVRKSDLNRINVTFVSLSWYFIS
jgi:hypothetical protein